MKKESWFKNYSSAFLRPDIMAGLITSAIVIPKAMAYATIAGLPVQVGLYTVLLPMIVYAFTGTSRVLSVSTSTTIAILTATQLNLVVPSGEPGALLSAAAMLTLLVGVILILAALLRLGFVASFISEPVLVGFKAGIAIVIIIDQLPKLLGIHFEKSGFIHNLISIVNHLPETNGPTLITGVIMIVLLIVIEKYIPKIPAPLVVIVIGVMGAFLIDPNALGLELVGFIPKGLPKLTMPDFSLAEELWPGALGIALMSFTETIAAGRAFYKSGEPAIVPNRELISTGLANALPAFLGSMSAGGGTSQTAMNRLTGARTPMASLMTATMALLTMLFLAGLFGMMPQATLAAVVIVYSAGLFKPEDFKAILRIRKTEFIWSLTAVAGVILLGTLNGILVAILLSMVSLAQQTANPPLWVLRRKKGTSVYRPLSSEHPGDEDFPGLLIVRPEGRIYFANASRVGEKIRSLIDKYNPSVVVIEMSGIPDMEYTALKMLADAEERLRQNGLELWLVDLNPKVFRIIQRSPLGEALTEKRMFLGLDLAVSKFLAGNNKQSETPSVV